MRKSIDDHKRELIDNLTAARQGILDAVMAVPPDRLDDACVGFWSVKDLLAHLVGWDFTNLQAVEEILAGKRPGFFRHYDKDWQSYNARLVEKYKIEPFAALLAALADSHQHLVYFLEGLTARDVVKAKAGSETGRAVSVRTLLRAEASDERKHAEQVKVFLIQNNLVE